MRQAHVWVPAAFCAFISLLALSMQIGADSWAWKPVFYCFLPMCFFFVGGTMVEMQREIRALSQRLAQLEGERSS